MCAQTTLGTDQSQPGWNNGSLFQNWVYSGVVRAGCGGCWSEGGRCVLGMGGCVPGGAACSVEVLQGTGMGWLQQCVLRKGKG